MRGLPLVSLWVLVVLVPSRGLAGVVPVSDLTLQKFIVVNNPCPTPGSNPTTITVNAGAQVTYCYVATNSHGADNVETPVTFSTHTLTDTQFGSLTSLIKNENGNTVGGSFDLQGATGTPCQGSTITTPSHFAYAETTQTITANTTNTATWNASNGTEKCLQSCTVPCDPPLVSNPSTDSATSNQVQVFVATPTNTPTNTPTQHRRRNTPTTPRATPQPTPRPTPRSTHRPTHRP